MLSLARAAVRRVHELKLQQSANVVALPPATWHLAGVDIPMTTVSQVFQFLDLAIVIVYFVYCMYFAERVKKIQVDTERRQLTVAHYAVCVTGIPPETQREDIRGDVTWHGHAVSLVRMQYEWMGTLRPKPDI